MKILLTEEQIRTRVKELGEQISREYAGSELMVIGILKGAAIFMADLVRSITIPVTMDFIAVSSYGTAAESSGVVRILKDLESGIEERQVLIVEDIIDTGLTLSYLLDNLRSRGPASVKICSLLDKPSRRKIPVHIDYLGFSVPDAFLVGYGLDFSGSYRNLPYVMELSPRVYLGSD